MTANKKRTTQRSHHLDEETRRYARAKWQRLIEYDCEPLKRSAATILLALPDCAVLEAAVANILGQVSTIEACYVYNQVQI